METSKIVYYESKIKVLKWISVVIILLISAVIYNEYNSILNSSITSVFIVGVIVSLLILAFVLYFYPSSSIEIYNDHFVYKKGKLQLSALWTEVSRVIAQMDKGMNVGLPISIFIETTKGRTNLIDIRMLKSNNNSKEVSKDFIAQIELLSKKTLEYGDFSVSFNKHIPVSQDYKG